MCSIAFLEAIWLVTPEESMKRSTISSLGWIAAAIWGWHSLQAWPSRTSAPDMMSDHFGTMSMAGANDLPQFSGSSRADHFVEPTRPTSQNMTACWRSSALSCGAGAVTAEFSRATAAALPSLPIAPSIVRRSLSMTPGKPASASRPILSRADC